MTDQGRGAPVGAEVDAVKRLQRQVRRLTWALLALSIATAVATYLAVRTPSHIVLRSGRKQLDLSPTEISLDNGRAWIHLSTEEAGMAVASLQLINWPTKIDIVALHGSASASLTSTGGELENRGTVSLMSMGGDPEVWAGQGNQYTSLLPQGVRVEEGKNVRRCVLEPVPSEPKKP